VTDVCAFDQTQNAFIDEPAHSLARTPACNAHVVGQPYNGKAQPELALEAAVAEQMRIDRAFEGGEFEARREKVFEFFAHLYSVDLLGFHRFVLRRELKVKSLAWDNAKKNGNLLGWLTVHRSQSEEASTEVVEGPQVTVNI